jgi:hypothetical protein
MNIPSDAPVPVCLYLSLVEVCGFSKPMLDRWCARYPEHARAFVDGLMANLTSVRFSAADTRRFTRAILGPRLSRA